MKRIILLISMVFTVSIIFNACKPEKKELTKEQVSNEKKEEIASQKYQCPMKCEKDKVYNKEGKCPVCKMKLRKKPVNDKE